MKTNLPEGIILTIFSFFDIKYLITTIQYLSSKYRKLILTSQVLDQPRGLVLQIELIKPHFLKMVTYAIKMADFVEIPIKLMNDG